jgi:YidC/Oxa1 family membrane protein insertase
MDKRSIIGLVLIFALMLGYSLWNMPSEKEREALRLKQDSIAAVQSKMAVAQKLEQQKAATTDTVKKDSAVNKTISGAFSKASQGQNKPFIIENDVLKLQIDSKGGRVAQAELKKYKTFDSLALILFTPDSSRFNLSLPAGNQTINTADLYFEPFWYSAEQKGNNHIVVSGKDSVQFGMRVYAKGADSAVNRNRYVEYLYTVRGNQYMVDFKINFVGMQGILEDNTNYLTLEWNTHLRQQEKSHKTELANTTIYYKPYQSKDFEYFPETKDKTESIKTKIQWISYKQQFFSTTLISKDYFVNAELACAKTSTLATPGRSLKHMESSIALPYDQGKSLSMQMYYGPNKFKELRRYKIDLEKQIPLGWSFFLLSWINRYAVITVFDWLSSFNLNYGIIILLLTIILKIVLFPIAYKTYMSSAKMRILKPEIDDINAKYPKKEDALKKQQATMTLYKKAGANPMAGCLPMLLQLPILLAFFRFFPASIELRQQHFLWATDLSAYDSVYNLPFTIPFYGDHVSLFCLLMTISTIIYTKLNNDMMAQSNQMPGMKTMMYLMPVMFLGFFNEISSGLSYYYLLANLITFAQMFAFRKFINEDKLHARIKENQKKPVKKSAFQRKLEEITKAQQAAKR